MLPPLYFQTHPVCTVELSTRTNSWLCDYYGDKAQRECNDDSYRRQPPYFAFVCLCMGTIAYLALFVCGAALFLSTTQTADPTSHPLPSTTPFFPPFPSFNHSDDYVTIKLGTCGADLQARKCLSIDTLFFHAFVAFGFDVVPDVEVKNADTLFELSHKLNEFARIVDASPIGGISISSIPGKRYNTTLSYDNAPPTDDMNGEYLIFIQNHVRCDM